MRRCLSRALVASILVLASSISASAGERYALIVSGASGGPPYLEQYSRWANELSRVLRERMKFVPANVVVLEEAGRGADRCDRCERASRHQRVPAAHDVERSPAGRA